MQTPNHAFNSCRWLIACVLGGTTCTPPLGRACRFFLETGWLTVDAPGRSAGKSSAARTVVALLGLQSHFFSLVIPSPSCIDGLLLFAPDSRAVVTVRTGAASLGPSGISIEPTDVGLGNPGDGCQTPQSCCTLPSKSDGLTDYYTMSVHPWSSAAGSLNLPLPSEAHNNTPGPHTKSATMS
jgi:hypothetical protein